MNLRAQAAVDLLSIVSDVRGGFGWAIVITNPAGLSVALSGLYADIGTKIDPETGVTVTGRHASVAVPVALLKAVFGEELPRAIADDKSKPWVVRVTGLDGISRTYKVQESQRDELGLCVCTLSDHRLGA